MIFLATNEDNIKEGPLLFIESVSMDVKGYNQEIFDSREKPTLKVKIQNEQFFVKLKRIVMMYQKGRPIICKVTFVDSSEMVIVPYEFDDKTMLCKKLIADDNKFEVSTTVEIAINQIDDLSIMQL